MCIRGSLKKQQREVKGLFRQVKKASDARGRRAGMEEIAEKLDAHMRIEEGIFYPAVQEIGTKRADEIVPISCPCLLYTSPRPRDRTRTRMPASA